MMKRRFWVWVCLLVGIVFVGDRLGGLVLNNQLLGSDFRYSKLYAGEIESDLIIIGNSRGVNSFYAPAIERKLSMSAFNLSYNGLSTEMVDLLLRDYLERGARPKLILIELSVLSAQNDDHGTFNFKPYSLSSPRIRDLIRQHSETEYRGCRFSHLYCFNSELFLRTQAFRNKSDQTWINRGLITDQVVAAQAQIDPKKLSLYVDNLTILRSTLAELDTQNIAVRLVLPPYLPQYAEKLTNLDEWVEVVEAQTKLPVWDYSRALTDTRYFADPGHLNEEGSNALLQLMYNDGLFNQ